MKKKKILIVANDTTFIYKLRKEIILEFINEGHEVVIVAKLLRFVKELDSMGCSLIDFDFHRIATNPVNDLILFKNIYKLIKREKPDIIFTNSIKPNVYFGIGSKLLKIPMIPNISGLGRALEYPGVLQKISIILYKMGMTGASIVLFQNEFNKNFFRSKKIISDNKENIVLPGSGVNLDEYNVLEYPKSEDINFLFIGRIRQEKGIDYIINSAQKLHEKYPNIKFDLCGLCEDAKYLEIFKKFNELDFIEYHGEIEDLSEFYKKAHCIVHPTYYPEGMSNVLLEACSHARPIITTDRPGCREIVDDGYNGYMIKTRNQEQLDSALEKFINLNYEDKLKMGLNGREKIENNFDRRFVVSQYMKIIETYL